MTLRTPRVMRVALSSFLLLALTTAAPGAACADTPSPVILTLKDHRFTPASFTVAAGQKVHILLINQDAAMEEFDSVDLSVEHDVTPKGRTSFDIGPLQPGEYSFMGEFHAKTAQGKVVAAPAPLPGPGPVMR